MLRAQQTSYSLIKISFSCGFTAILYFDLHIRIAVMAKYILWGSMF